MKFKYLFLFVTFFATASLCQNAGLDGVPSTNDSVLAPTWYQMFTNIPGNCLDYCKITFNNDKIPLYSGVALATAGLILTDDKTWKASDKLYKKSNTIKSMSDFFVEIGDGSSQFGLAGVFALYGFAVSDNKALRTASQITQAVLSSGAAVQVLKHITGRQSPFVSTKTGGRWDFFPNQIQYHKHVPAYDAFPSGHLTTTLATVVVVAENYPNIKWIKPVGYSLAGLLAVSMVNTGIHWYSDYPLAMVMGYTFGMIASHPDGISDLLLGQVAKNVQISPSLVSNRIGLGLFYSLN